eukprot:208573-Pleurochrysis_carterae.AAC.1
MAPRLYDLYIDFKGEHEPVYVATAAAVIANVACNYSVRAHAVAALSAPLFLPPSHPPSSSLARSHTLLRLVPHPVSNSCSIDDPCSPVASSVAPPAHPLPLILAPFSARCALGSRLVTQPRRILSVSEI